ncbi:MAG: hypothetical protein WKF84_06340 [Pyrinomonadaceae bacterium]
MLSTAQRMISQSTPKFFNDHIALTPLDDWLWQADSCASLLCEHFGVKTLEPFGLDGKYDAIRSAGAALRYALETQRASAAHVNAIEFFAPLDHLVLDPVTVRNLDLIDSPAQGQQQQQQQQRALSVGRTGRHRHRHGRASLRSWLLRPSIKRGEIEARHGAVEELLQQQQRRDQLRAYLKEVADLERLIGRLNLGTATPRDLVAIKRSLQQIPFITRALSDATSSLLMILVEAADDLAGGASFDRARYQRRSSTSNQRRRRYS